MKKMEMRITGIVGNLKMAIGFTEKRGFLTQSFHD